MRMFCDKIEKVRGKIMIIDGNTKLKDILAAYPYLEEEAIKIDDRFKIIHSPIGKMLLKKATVQDLSDKAGLDVQVIVDQIRTIIEEHEKQDGTYIEDLDA